MLSTARPSMSDTDTLLSGDDPAPFEIINGDGKSPILLVCEHAGQAIPQALTGLGLDSQALEKHIAWDIGAGAVARHLSRCLDAPLVVQRYSRLVIDANRPFQAPDCIPEISDGVPVPGNRNLTAAARQARYDEIHQPFHAAISALLDRRQAEGCLGCLVTVHSFTPVFAGKPRTMAAGLLFNTDDRLANALRDALENILPQAYKTVMNAPYAVDDASDYAIPVHGEARGLPHVLIELRNDLIAKAEEQELWAEYLSTGLTDAIKELKVSP